MPSEYPEIDRSRTPDQLRQRGYLPEAGEWRGVGPKRVHSIPPGMDPSLVAKSDRVPPWVEEGYPNTKKGYQLWLEERTNQQNELLPEPPEGPPQFKRKNWKPGNLYREDPNLRQKNEEFLERFRQEQQKPKPKSLLDSPWGPYAETGNMLLGKSKEALAMIDQYLKENPETISGLVGPGSAGPVGMVFKLNPGRVPVHSLANQIDNLSIGTRPAGLTRNPTTWWIENAAETKAADSGEKFYQLHEALTKKTGGPGEGRMALSFDPDTGVAKLEFVGVVPTERGSGFGGELARSAILKAKQLGAKTLELNALPGNVMSETSKARDQRLVDWYASMGFVEQTDQPMVGGMHPMHIPDLSKWPPKSKAVAAYEAHARQNRRLVETLDPNHRAPDVPPTEGGTHFVPEEVPREVDGLEAMRNERDTAAFRRRERDSESRQANARWINRSILRDRAGAPADVVESAEKHGLPEGWMYPSYTARASDPPRGSRLWEDRQQWRRATEYYRAHPEEMNTGPTPPTRTDRGRPDPGESWSDYLARIRGLQR